MLSKSPLLPLLQRGSRIKKAVPAKFSISPSTKGVRGICMNHCNVKVLRFRSQASILVLGSILLSFGSLALLGAYSQDRPPTIESLGWLAGCWEGTYANGRTVSEQWMKPLGGVMMGMSRTVRDGKTIAFENVRLEQSETGLIHYVANPSGQKEATFALVKLEGTKAIFENPAHDYPQRIIYHLLSPDSLVARIEGTANGKERGSNFPYRRVRCE